uniref:Uncharacterized protein n=1 Tax=Leersia perrieri TaxID=77586 RepID=A0A0D9XWW9_9ORYZ
MASSYMRVTHRDEEGHKVTEKLPVPETRRPDTARHLERKLEEQGLHRLDRRPANGPPAKGIGAPPPKSGRGGKFTWEGPDSIVDSQLDPLPPAIDRNDPNYDEDEAEEGEKGGQRRRGDVAGVSVVEPAKAPPSPLQQL